MNLRRVDQNLSLRPGALLLYCPIYNERSLLPIFLAHHRKLKVDGFVFIDNGSTDGSLEFLVEQSDCIVYATRDSFAQANFGMDWIGALMQRHSPDRWALYLDCDELLVYEDCENKALPDFITPFSAKGDDSFYAIMLDVYSKRPDGIVTLEDCRDFAKSRVYVDRDYVIRRTPNKPWKPKNRGIQVLGGPRGRLHQELDREIKNGWFHYFVAGQVDRFIEFIPTRWIPLLAKFWPRPMFAQHKTPLNFIGEGFKYNDSHSSQNQQAAPYLMGILHLKFSTELQKKAEPTFAYKNHYHKGLERIRLSCDLEKKSSQPLYRPDLSVRYENSASLAAASLIGEWASPVCLGNGDFARTTQYSQSK